MKRLSRRTLLTGSGAALTLSIAGCLETESDTDDSGDEDESRDEALEDQLELPSELGSALAYFYEPDGPFSINLHRDPQTVEEMAGGNDEILEVLDGSSDVEWHLRFEEMEESDGPPYTIWTGSFDLQDELDGTEYDEFTLLDVEDDRNDSHGFATDGTVGLAGAKSRLESVLTAYTDGKEPYLSTREDITSVLNAVIGESGGAVAVGELLEKELSEGLDESDELSSEQLPDVLGFQQKQEEDKDIEWAFAGWYDDGAAEYTDDFATLIEYMFALDMEDTEPSADDELVIANKTQTYVPPEERPDPPGIPQYEGYDAETDELLFRFTDGDEFDVEQFEIKIEDEILDVDWTRGNDTIRDGTIIGIPWDAIEPGDSMTVSFESPDGRRSHGVGSNVLVHFPIDVTVDPETDTATVEYYEGPPLAGDRLSIELYDRQEPHHDGPTRTVEMTNAFKPGDTKQVADVEFDDMIRIVYERSDGETVDIGGGTVSPPGEFEISFDTGEETATVTYPEHDSADERQPADVPDPEPLDAEQYEIQLNGDQADTQFTDTGDDIEPGDELTVTGVEIGDEISVHWVGDGGPYTISTGVATPAVSLEYAYDESEEILTIEHGGGDAIEMNRLVFEGHIDGEQQVREPAEDVSVLEAGDTITLEEIDIHAFIGITFDGQTLDRVHVFEVAEDE